MEIVSQGGRCAMAWDSVAPCLILPFAMLYSRFFIISRSSRSFLSLIINMNSRSKRISVKCHICYPHSAQCQAANAQCPTWREDSFSKFLKQSLLWTLCLMQRNALLAIKRRSIFLHIPIFSFILLTTGGLKNALKLRVARTPDFTPGRFFRLTGCSIFRLTRNLTLCRILKKHLKRDNSRILHFVFLHGIVYADKAQKKK